ncbi:uncharacterized protein LOC141613932 [Silene latifolia]|uniref:uncharacterized protein LOC141613932 n=1 Tax=Silene latifolia TaxID=37657 RepID=UPI003D7895B0
MEGVWTSISPGARVNPKYHKQPHTPSTPPNFEKKFIQIELPAGVEDDQELKARVIRYATARIKVRTSDPTGLNASQASQEFFEGEKIQKYVAEAEQIAERLKVSVGNAPEFGEVVTEPPKKTVGIDASTRQISEVLESLGNDGGGWGGNPRVEPRRESVKADTPTKSIAVSWSKPLSPASPGLEDQVVCSPVPSVRQLLLESSYTEEEIDECIGPSKDDEARLWTGDEGHEHVHEDGLNENAENVGRLADTDHERAADIVGQADGRSENAESRPVVGDAVHEQVHGEGLPEIVERLSDNQPSDMVMEKSTVPELGLDTQELMECLFSTAEMKEAARGNPAYGSGSGGEATVKKDVIENVEQHSNNGGGNVDVVGRAEITLGILQRNGAGHSVNDSWSACVMVHMFFVHRGEPFDCTLGTKESNDLMRAEIAATLVLGDINEDREDVLSGTIDLLDSKYYSSPRQSEICKACHVIASFMSDYLEARDDAKSRAKDIPSFRPTDPGLPGIRK